MHNWRTDSCRWGRTRSQGRDATIGRLAALNCADAVRCVAVLFLLARQVLAGLLIGSRTLPRSVLRASFSWTHSESFSYSGRSFNCGEKSMRKTLLGASALIS